MDGAAPLGTTALLSISAGHCKHEEGPKSEAVGCPQINPSCYELSPLRCSPRDPSPGAPSGPGVVTLLPASLFSLSVSHPPVLQEHSVPRTDITFNDVQIGSGHLSIRAQHIGEGTWWLFIGGQQLRRRRRREGRLLCPRSRHAGIDLGLFLSSRRSNNQIYFSCRSECRALLFILWL